MINNFILYLNENCDYRLLNGYEDLKKAEESFSDFDFVVKQNDFLRINSIIKDFCYKFNYKIVQVYHQSRFAKNFFLFDFKNNSLLNLDIYGNLSRNGIEILSENEIFQNKNKFNKINILKPSQEFIQYFIKKVDKLDLTYKNFEKLQFLFKLEANEVKSFIKYFFSNTYKEIIKSFSTDNFELISKNINLYNNDFLNNKKNKKDPLVLKSLRIFKRIIMPTGISICFLGPDGSGKSTIIKYLYNQPLPFRRIDYFHLKPIPKDDSIMNVTVTNPQQAPLYSKIKSFVKLGYYFFLYNFGWAKYIIPLKIRSSLVIFDRYYDDILVDYRRFRYKSIWGIEKLVKNLIPRPKIYFILTAEANIIFERKQEVTFEELKRQIVNYNCLRDDKKYFLIDTNREPEQIAKEVINILMGKMHERY